MTVVVGITTYFVNETNLTLLPDWCLAITIVLVMDNTKKDQFDVYTYSKFTSGLQIN